ncbi:MAG: transcriptional repressor [Spirochaetia bacterium]|jgi:Fe2+ or Zn2+ uptake regulation protein|nr:transcriptional repressor [Spirochaetia bacterium]
MNTLHVKEILEKKEIKPSLHRIKIFEYLADNIMSHPTVDMIYQDILKDIPTLSKTTIYNTLKTFVENKIVRVITIDENEVRFDVKIDAHAHMKCVKCNSLYNVDVDPELFSKFFEENNKNKHKIFETHIYLRGICDKCLNKTEI